MKRRIILAAVAAVIAATVAALASQNALLSPTTGTVSGLQMTNSYNSALDSLNTANSGATAPNNQLSGSASLGNWWLNTTSAPYGLGMYDGSSNWPVMASLDPTAHAWNVQIGGGTGTLASASSVDLCSTSRNYLTISGTTSITSFGSTCPAGVVKLVTFSGALTLTYNATSLIIPGAQSVSPTSAGDQATLISLGGGNWQVASYTPSSGSALVNPAVDVGSMLMTFAISPPSSKYMFAFGQTISRTTYSSLLTTVTISESVTRTSGSPTLTGFTDTTQIPTGAPIEGSGIPPSLTISSCTATTCTMSGNASSSGTASVTIFPNGNGDGSTTFNLPNCQGVVLAGRDNMSGTPRAVLSSTYYGANPDSLGAFGGNQNVTMALGNLIAHTHANTLTDPGHSHNTTAGTTSFNTPASSGASALQPGGSAVSTSTTGITITNASAGSASPTPMRTVQPTLTANCMIRVLAMMGAPSSPNSLASNDNRPPIADRRRSLV